MPNEEEIRKIMEKARKAASGGKTSPEKKSKPEIKSERKPLVQEKSEEEKKPDSSKSSPEIAELKTLIIQQNQNITQQNERVGAIENFLKEAQRQAQAQMGGQPAPANPNQIIDQPASEDSLTDEQRLAQLQAEQDKGGQGIPGQPQIPANVPPALAYLYAFNPTFKEIAATVRTAMASKAAKTEGGEVSLDSLGRELIVGLIKRQLLGQAEGGDNLDQIKTYANMQNVLMGSFFNTLKYLGKEGAQRVMGNIFEETVSPRSTLPTPPPSEGHIV